MNEYERISMKIIQKWAEQYRDKLVDHCNMAKHKTATINRLSMPTREPGNDKDTTLDGVLDRAVPLCTTQS